MGQFNRAESQSDVSTVEKADAVEVLLQCRGDLLRKNGHAVLPPLPSRTVI
jgi:hypothetical protein